MTEKQGRMGILVGGGPAPGINSVIGAATIRSWLSGCEVIGIQDGFKWIMQGDAGHWMLLTIEGVSRIHFRGGCHIGISRANPTKNPAHVTNAVETLLALGIDKLITIGGDDTAFSAMKLEQEARDRIHVVHVPKTIDNDLDLPPEVFTFGFQTARHYGVEVVQNLMTDAKTTSRWYFVITMGRKAGHLAMGIGKAAGATLTMIPEEFPPGELTLKELVDNLVVAILKRMAMGRLDGVAVLAEGLVESLKEEDLKHIATHEIDEHDHIRLAEIRIGEILKRATRKRLQEFGLDNAIVSKNIGYELRCADPIPFDLEYTRDLGYSAAKYLLEGGNASLVAIEGGHFRAIPFIQLIDPYTGKMAVRMVDINSTRYKIARRYMLRLRRDDFHPENRPLLEKIAAVAGLTVDQFTEEFQYLIRHEPPPISLRPW
ncbi:MAG: 6-phosphofructokinase [Bradymonadales bacterium]|nr:6-phosphofructokinase [Bradymonadales bacterium]